MDVVSVHGGRRFLLAPITVLLRIVDATERTEEAEERIEATEDDARVNPRAGAERGSHDIRDEFTFKNNRGFIFHKSPGFEAGDEKELETVMSFIEEKAKSRDIMDQIHAIWFCFNLPLVESEKNFFKMQRPGNVPVVAIFTKFDVLATRVYDMNKNEEENEKNTCKTLKEKFEELRSYDYPPRAYVCFEGIYPGGRQRFQILVVGNAGVGKSSLITNIFNVDPENIDLHHDDQDCVGTININRIYESPDNLHFTLHDSKGFEPVNQSLLMQFSDSDHPSFAQANKDARSTIDALVEQLQPQMCLLSSSEEPFYYVPVSTSQNYPGFMQTLEALTDVTTECLKAKALFVPQRINPIQQSIDAGFERYWKDVRKTPKLGMQVMHGCLLQIHLDIMTVWDFRDPQKLLIQNTFYVQMLELIEPLMAQTQSARQVFLLNTGCGIEIGTASDIKHRATLEPAVFVKAYVVHLTALLHDLHVITLQEGGQRPLNRELVLSTVKQYEKTKSASIHNRIPYLNLPLPTSDTFSTETTFEMVRDHIVARLDMFDGTPVFNPTAKIDKLIDEYRSLRGSVKADRAKAAQFKASGRSGPTKEDSKRRQEIQRMEERIAHNQAEMKRLNVPAFQRLRISLEELHDEITQKIYAMIGAN
ncbi:hypothetical protein H0H92_015780 [Tricholoma furcatifolium]|nr:hypothetical protein H0H92_015780 [Tricholoma furcatifolium]